MPEGSSKCRQGIRRTGTEDNAHELSDVKGAGRKVLKYFREVLELKGRGIG